jgi:signal transduction histidine kinase
MSTRRHFVQHIAHEIRTPLNTIHFGCKLLFDMLVGLLKPEECRLDRPVKNTVKEWLLLLADIDESVDNAVDVLSDLINFDKMSEGGR